MNTEDIKDFIRNRALRYAGSCSSQGSMEFNILNELYFDLFGEPAVNTIPKYDNLAIKIHYIENGHEYVDLGLPSGTLWATCNVGANKPWKCGDYFAWGETTTKEFYEWDNYKYGTGEHDGDYMTKYNIPDSRTTLDLTDDAAYANCGNKWRIPTCENIEELRNECYWVWTENYNGSNVKGYIVYRVKSLNDKGRKTYKDYTPSSYYTLSDTHIFLPSAGCHDNIGHFGYYWSSSICESSHSDAWYIDFCSYGVHTSKNCRCEGYTIRPVLNQKS